MDLRLGRAIHGPIRVSGETFDKLSGPLVHTDSPLKARQLKAPRDWSLEPFAMGPVQFSWPCRVAENCFTTVCNEMISNLIRKKLKLGSETVMVIVINSENVKVGNGNPMINYEKAFLELRSRYQQSVIDSKDNKVGNCLVTVLV